jgi:hypothetical protein
MLGLGGCCFSPSVPDAGDWNEDEQSSPPLSSLQSKNASARWDNDMTLIDGLQVADADQRITGQPVAAGAADSEPVGPAHRSEEDGILQEVVHTCRATGCEAESGPQCLAERTARGSYSGKAGECADDLATHDDERRRLEILCQHFAESKAREIVRCIHEARTSSRQVDKEAQASSRLLPRPLNMPRVLYPAGAN